MANKLAYSLTITHDNPNYQFNNPTLRVNIVFSNISGVGMVKFGAAPYQVANTPGTGTFSISLAGFPTGLIDVFFKDDQNPGGRKLCAANYLAYDDWTNIAGFPLTDGEAYPTTWMPTFYYRVQQYGDGSWRLEVSPNGLSNVGINTRTACLSDTVTPLTCSLEKTANEGDGLNFSSTEVNGATVADVLKGLNQKLGGAVLLAMFEDLSVEELTVPLAATFSKTDTTSNGAADGTITVFPTGGSGSYSFLWNDLVITQNRVGLVAGTYSVEITDNGTAEVVNLNNIVILEPQVEQPVGTILFAPQVNSIRFVDDSILDQCSNPPNADNSFLLEQGDRFMKRDPYFQKVSDCDQLIMQINSDFGVISPVLKSCEDDSEVKGLILNSVQTNIGQTATFNIRIQSNGGTTSRVYFSAGGGIPILLNVGDPFDIINNPDGFDNTYEIINILNDELLGDQYIVINKTYALGSPSLNAEGIFLDQALDFDIYHLIANFSGVQDGRYYIQVNGFIDGAITKTINSEPILVLSNHEATIKIEFTNIDNAFNIDYQTGLTHQIRVPARMYKRTPGAEQTSIRSTDGTVTKLSAKPQRKILLEFFSLPSYLHELISLAFDHDTVRLNGVEFGSQDGLQEPSYIDGYNLANSSISVEQTEWFETYNSDDLGGIDEGGFIDNNQGGFISLE